MRRDFVFMVDGVPIELGLRDTNLYFIPIADSFRQELLKLAVKHSDIHRWMTKTKGNFLVAGFRTDFKTKEEGLDSAYQHLSSILDGYSFFTEKSPSICPYVQVREGEDSDASWEIIGYHALVRIHSKDGKAEKASAERVQQLANRFLSYFNTVPFKHGSPPNELIEQIALSSKMFRHGRSAEAFGIEFLCKFTSLEGLVCGPAAFGKKRLLVERLSKLFRHRSKIESQINELWGMRCEASHQGKAFSTKFAVMIGRIDNLMLGTMVFALDHIDKAIKIDDLWQFASNYSLPSEAFDESTKHVATRIAGKTEVKWIGVGSLIDSIFSTDWPPKQNP